MLLSLLLTLCSTSDDYFSDRNDALYEIMSTCMTKVSTDHACVSTVNDGLGKISDTMEIVRVCKIHKNLWFEMVASMQTLCLFCEKGARSVH